MASCKRFGRQYCKPVKKALQRLEADFDIRRTDLLLIDLPQATLTVRYVTHVDFYLYDVPGCYGSRCPLCRSIASDEIPRGPSLRVAGHFNLLSRNRKKFLDFIVFDCVTC